MRTVRVIYRREQDGAWIGTSPEIPGYVAYGDTYEQARDRAVEGFPWFAERDDLLLAHIRPDRASGVVDQSPDVKRAARVEFRSSREPARSRQHWRSSMSGERTRKVSGS